MDRESEIKRVYKLRDNKGGKGIVKESERDISPNTYIMAEKTDAIVMSNRGGYASEDPLNET